MNVIVLSGGSGKRLWPLSNEVRSKQFLKIFTREDGLRESMAQRMFRMLKQVDPDAKITIATSQNQIPQIRAQLGEEVGISVEPCRRDTFPAILLAALYLKKSGAGGEEPVVVCPVDPYVDENYYACLKKLSDLAGGSRLTLMGIEPTFPSESYGYIIPESQGELSRVLEFKEKPDRERAMQYIQKGALWNGGVFAFKLSYILDLAEKKFGISSYEELYSSYDRLPKISFDYAVVEEESDIRVLRFKGEWKDLGTWNMLSEAMAESISGSVKADECENTHIVNELGLPLVALGIENAVIAATPDGILVADKKEASRLKDFVGDRRPMYERRLWGEYKVLDYKLHEDGNNTLVKELIISAGKHISYQRHQRRMEIWTFTEGTGLLVLDDVVKEVKRGDVAVILPGMKHAIMGLSELHIVEVQMGDELVEEDIERLEWDWAEM
ncbi:MAG: mannose-1-phosphate guanylyltransferase [Lachnospiraceae bacterium]|nr:mannose-1-phosphate guanylyltransferase [Lachnospiraceae bacterium]